MSRGKWLVIEDKGWAYSVVMGEGKIINLVSFILTPQVLHQVSRVFR
jgi:hypothetical protein